MELQEAQQKLAGSGAGSAKDAEETAKLRRQVNKFFNLPSRSTNPGIVRDSWAFPKI